MELLPVVNKIDLPAAEPDRVKQELEDVIGIDQEDVVLASAKSNIGIEEILEKIVDVVPDRTVIQKPHLKHLSLIQNMIHTEE